MGARGDGGADLAGHLSASSPTTPGSASSSACRKPMELAILQELAAWREREAQSRDVPRGRVIKDDAIYEIAQQQPTTPAALAQLRTVPQGLRALARGRGDPRRGEEGVSRCPRTRCRRLPKHRPTAQRQRRRRRSPQGPPQDDQREPWRRRQGDRHGRRSRGDRRRRSMPTSPPSTAGGASCSAKPPSS